MQELIEWVRNHPGQTGKSLVIDKATELLEQEKEQMIEAGNVCVLKASVFREKLDEMSDDEKRDLLMNDSITHGEEYYNETYETK